MGRQYQNTTTTTTARETMRREEEDAHEHQQSAPSTTTASNCLWGGYRVQVQTCHTKHPQPLPQAIAHGVEGVLHERYGHIRGPFSIIVIISSNVYKLKSTTNSIEVA
jgi:hypothetical protein